MKRTLSYLWQLPQNGLGLLLRQIYKGNDTEYNNAIVRRSTSMRGGISLGRYIIVNQWMSKTDIKHEYGHCRQSIMLGPLYLLVVGLPSLILAMVCRDDARYFRLYPERWADVLGGIKRM